MKGMRRGSITGCVRAKDSRAGIDPGFRLDHPLRDAPAA